MEQPSDAPKPTYDIEAARDAKARLLEKYSELLEPLGAIGIGGTNESEGVAIRIRDEFDEDELAVRTEAIAAALREEGFPDMPVDVRGIGEIRFQ